MAAKRVAAEQWVLVFFRGQPAAKLPPTGHGSVQVLAAVAGNGVALEPDGARVAQLLERPQHGQNIEAAAVERLNQAVQPMALVGPPSAPLMLTANR